MFFLIGGIQPRKKTLETRPEACPSCGENKIRLQRLDRYISLFFIPVLRIKKGIPYLACEGCGKLLDGVRGNGRFSPAVCGSCGRELRTDYIYCPTCGRRI